MLFHYSLGAPSPEQNKPFYLLDAFLKWYDDFQGRNCRSEPGHVLLIALSGKERSNYMADCLWSSIAFRDRETSYDASHIDAGIYFGIVK